MNNTTLENTRNQFFTQLSVRQEDVRSVLSTAWRLKLLAEIMINRSEWTEDALTIAKAIRGEWIDAAVTSPQLRPYTRMLNLGEKFFCQYAATHPVLPPGHDDTIDYIVVNNFWGDNIEIQQLSTGERVPANEIFRSNAEMYAPYARIKGAEVPIISLMHMGL